MAKNAITDLSTNSALNTDIGGVDAQGTAPASNMNDLVQELGEMLADTNAGTAPWADTMTIGDAADLTKELRFELSAITTGTTRVITVPDANVTIPSGTLVTEAGTQTLTNKTLTAATLGGTTNLTGGQIAFPASQSASADANTLDDYEEGTFTPTIIGTSAAGAGTYSVQTGTYTKIGRVVFFGVSMTWSAHTGTGNMKVGALPFAIAANGGGSLSFRTANLTLPAGATIQGFADGGADTITIESVTPAGTAASLAIDTAASLAVAGFYIV